MTISNGYATADQFKAHIGVGYDDVVDDATFDEKVQAASRAIDEYCHVPAGSFVAASGTATARLFYGSGRVVDVDPFGTLTDLVVKTDTAGTGSYASTLTISTGFIVEPVNALATGKPVTRLRLVDGTTFPTSTYGRPNVQVTAKWGYPSIPDPVSQACLLVAAELWKRKDAPFGVIGTDDFGPIRLSADAFKSVTSLLGTFRHAAGVGQA